MSCSAGAGAAAGGCCYAWVMQRSHVTDMQPPVADRRNYRAAAVAAAAVAVVVVAVVADVSRCHRYCCCRVAAAADAVFCCQPE